MEIKRTNKQSGPNFDYYESETEPPTHPILAKIWHRPSDGAHFGLNQEGKWVQYAPMNLKLKLKVGESVTVTVPNP